MSNIRGKELDTFFRQRLSEKEHSFEEDHWLALEQRLKKDKQKRLVGLLISIGAAAMLIVAFSVFLLRNAPEQQPLTDKLADKANATRHNRPQETAVNKSNVAAGSANKSPIRDVTMSPDTKDFAVSKREVAGNRSRSYTTSLPDGNGRFSFPEDLIVSTAKSADPGIQQKSFPSAYPLIFAARTKNVSDIHSADQKKDRKAEFKPTLSISVFAGPDINGVNNLKNNDGGISGGIALTYTVHRKWSVSVGAAYAKKLYSTDFVNYRPATTYRFPIDPSIVDADCRVLDIPLNVNYTAWSRKDQAVQLSAGLSSYFMLKEDYHFEYRDPATKGPTYYETKNKNRHYLGVVNLGVGYKKHLSENISVGVSPFIKLPVTDIGYGNVKLQSAGVTTSISIKLPSVKPSRK
ncbi:MAG TPA: hypothetical protein VGE26_02410 [Sphingobacteriaceae bacterium]